MKTYILSDDTGLIGCYLTKEAAREAAENSYKSDLHFMPEFANETFQAYWEDECHLEEVEFWEDGYRVARGNLD